MGSLTLAHDKRPDRGAFSAGPRDRPCVMLADMKAAALFFAVSCAANAYAMTSATDLASMILHGLSVIITGATAAYCFVD